MEDDQWRGMVDGLLSAGKSARGEKSVNGEVRIRRLMTGLRLKNENRPETIDQSNGKGNGSWDL